MQKESILNSKWLAEGEVEGSMEADIGELSTYKAYISRTGVVGRWEIKTEY